MRTLMKEHATYSDFMNDDFHEKLFLFQLSDTQRKEQAVFTKYDGTPVHYPKRRYVNLIDTIFDKGTGMRRSIRYVEGERSLFVDEQSKDPNFKPKLYRSEFKHGKYLALGSDPLLIQFLMITNFNESNLERDESVIPLFKFVDTKQQFKKIMKEEALEQDAIQWCNKAPWDEVLRYARILIKDADFKDSDEIRFDLKRFARSRPKRFMNDMKTPMIVRKSHILEAIAKEILFLNESTRSIAWQDNHNVPIITAPVGIDPVDHFVQTSFTLEGEKVYNALKDFLFPQPVMAQAVINTEIPAEAPIPRTPSSPILSANEDSFEELGELFDIACKKGVIKSKRNWHFYKKCKAMGKPNFVTELRLNKTVLDALREDLRTRGN